MMATPLAFKPNLLCIVPPYTITCPPAGAAALMAYLAANGCNDFSFLDLRLHVPYVYAPTYRPTGAFAESFVLDVPDLPLVLEVLTAHDQGSELTANFDEEWFIEYCVRRGIHPQTLSSYLRRLDRFLEASFAQLPELRFVGFSTWTSNYLTTLMAAAHLKRRRRPPYIVVGGPQVTESPSSARLALRSGLVDAVALGEGEETLLDLYQAFSRDGQTVTSEVAGTLRVDSASGAFVSSERNLLRLKELPLPRFDEMKLGSYRSPSGGRELPYQLSRGCTDKCSFCSEWVFWRKFRLGSMETAVEQIAELQARYGAEVIQFTDSLVNGTMPRLREFAELLLQRGVTIPWFGFMRAEMDAETAKLIRRAGCVHAFIGIESLATETLDLMNKRRTEADNMRALRIFLEAGIRVVAGFIPGFPGDTRERFMHTARVLVELQRRFPGLLETNIEPFILTPGQPIYRELEKYGIETSPWPDEVVARAGRYQDIVDGIPCAFTGPNQGIDRLGELRVAETLLGMSSVYRRLEEVHSPFEFDFVHIEGDVFIARIHAGAGHCYAILVTRAEKETLERMRSADALAAQEATVPLLERQHYRRHLGRLELEHAVVAPRDRPTLFATVHVTGAADETLLRGSPFLIARVFAGELLAVHANTLEWIKLPAAAGKLLGTLARAPRSKRELTLAARESAIEPRLDELVRKGLVEACSPVAAKLMPPPEVVPPLADGLRHLPLA